MSNPCQIPFSPHLGTGLRRRKEKKRKKDIYWNVFWSMHTYIHIHACTHTLLPQLPHPSTPILHTTNTNEHIHYAPHTHTHVLLLYTIPHPQTSYLAASLNSRHTYVHTISQRGRSSITDCVYLYIQAQTKPIYV